MNNFWQYRRQAFIAASSSVGLIGLLAGSAIAQQPSQLPPVNTRICTTGNQACQGSPANAILSDGPLSVSVSEIRQQNINGTRELVFEQVADSVNDQAQFEETASPTKIGPLDLNPGSSTGIGIRDVQD